MGFFVGGDGDFFLLLLSLDFFKAKLADIGCKVCRLQSKAQSTA